MSDKGPIACGLHDHLEVACLYRYALTVTLRDGAVATGTATDTRTAAGGIEYLVLANGEERRELPMHEIANITVDTPGARFSELSFD